MISPSDPEESVTAENWDARRLCSDESCIGVVRPDGRCSECGRKHEPPSQPARTASEVEAKPPAARTHDPEPPRLAAPAAAAGEDDWSARRLCSDESCIGVIGSDGRCKECGKPAAG